MKNISYISYICIYIKIKTVDDLTKKILEAGIENCLFIAPVKQLNTFLGFSFTPSADPEIMLPCKISEERYNVRDNYKITLVCTIDGFSKNHFYISDLSHMIDDGTVEFFIKKQ